MVQPIMIETHHVEAMPILFPPEKGGRGLRTSVRLFFDVTIRRHSPTIPNACIVLESTTESVPQTKSLCYKDVGLIPRRCAHL